MLALWSATSCLDITSNVPQIGAITPVILPSPSVVVGDVSRDTGGRAAPLQIVALDTRGDTLRDVIVKFYAVDSTGGLVVDSLTGFAHGAALSPSAAVVASVQQSNGVGGFIQTPTIALPVVPVPVRALRGPDTTFVFNPFAADTLSFLSPPLTVTVQATDTVVQKYVVSYRIAYAPPVKPGGTGPTLVLRGNGADSTVAVTNASGQGSLQLQLRPSAISLDLLQGNTTDSAVVVVRVQYQGNTLPILPDSVFVIPIKAGTPTT
jgi:hypothetical protein